MPWARNTASHRRASSLGRTQAWRYRFFSMSYSAAPSMTMTGRRSRRSRVASRTEAGVRMVDRVNCIPSSSIRFRLTRLYGVSVPCSVSSKPSRPETNSTSRRFRRGSWKALTAMPTAMPTSVSDARYQAKIQGLASVTWVTVMLRNTMPERAAALEDFSTTAIHRLGTVTAAMTM